MTFRPVLLALLLALAVPGVASANSATRIIVKRDAGLTAAERADIRGDADVRLVETLRLPRTEVVAAEPGDVGAALRALRSDPDVVYAERDRLRTIAADTYLSWLWAIPLIDADDAWSLVDATLESITGDGQVVAVTDTGIDPSHPDLDDRISSQKDFVDNQAQAVDDDGHGTHVSGTIAAERNNNEGVVGIAPDARIMALRVLDDEGSGWDSDIADAFRWAADHNVKVVNVSLGGEGVSQTLRDAIAYADDTLFVIAAGNGGDDGVGDDNDDHPVYPCNTPEPNVLCVGATTQSDQIADFSNEGARSVDIFAPGNPILSTVPLALTWEHWQAAPGVFVPYAWYAGTSMAAPHVAGVAALVRQAAPALEPEDLKEILLASADVDPSFQGRSVSGGRLNAAAAVQLALDGTVLPDRDLDGWADAADACPDDPVNPSPDGCPLDDDWDRVLNAADNCALTPNPNQRNVDGDALGDACDPDIDEDGIPNGADLCAAVPGPASNHGCPQQPPGPPLPPTGTLGGDADGDGITDVSDACPKEHAKTQNGCPLAQVASLSAKPQERSATVRVTATRLATVRITVERKRGRRWVRVARRTVAGTRATVRLSRLERGTHRVRIAISSSAGNGTPVSKTFRVR